MADINYKRVELFMARYISYFLPGRMHKVFLQLGLMPPEEKWKVTSAPPGDCPAWLNHGHL